ncbi:MAG: PEP-CTERM sorting domain-containing protein [Fimbriimonadaceae bacterium]
MNNILKTVAVTGIAACAFAAANAQTALLNDTTVAVPTVPAPTLSIVDIKTEAFASGNFTGELTSVVAKTDATGDNLIFAWILANDETSINAIRRITVNDWMGWSAAVAQHEDAGLVGTSPKSVLEADRSVDGDVIGFDFPRTQDGLLSAGTNSTVFWALSDATDYKESFASVIDGTVANVGTYAPVPEPASMLALATGLGALVARRRARR